MPEVYFGWTSRRIVMMKWLLIATGVAYLVIFSLVQASYDEKGNQTSGWQLWLRFFLFLFLSYIDVPVPSVIAVLSSTHGEHHNPAIGRRCEGEIARPRSQSRQVHGTGGAGNPEGRSHVEMRSFAQSRRRHPATC